MYHQRAHLHIEKEIYSWAANSIEDHYPLHSASLSEALNAAANCIFHCTNMQTADKDKHTNAAIIIVPARKSEKIRFRRKKRKNEHSHAFLVIQFFYFFQTFKLRIFTKYESAPIWYSSVTKKRNFWESVTCQFYQNPH